MHLLTHSSCGPGCVDGGKSYHWHRYWWRSAPRCPAPVSSLQGWGWGAWPDPTPQVHCCRAVTSRRRAEPATRQPRSPPQRAVSPEDCVSRHHLRRMMGRGKRTVLAECSPATAPRAGSQPLPARPVFESNAPSWRKASPSFWVPYRTQGSGEQKETQSEIQNMVIKIFIQMSET